MPEKGEIMSHRHFCDVAGHEWECGGTAPRLLAGDTEPSVCMCIRHRTPMEIGEHSECSIEVLACPEHREEQRRRMEEANNAEAGAEEANPHEGWESPFRLMTDAERLKSDKDHQFMEEVVYAGLQNINTGFDAAGIFHFSPADFGEVINRCEPLHIFPNGIEVFTTDGGFIDCVFAMDDGSPDESFGWARRLAQKYLEVPNISMSATFHVPDSALASGVPTSNLRHSVEGDSQDE